MMAAKDKLKSNSSSSNYAPGMQFNPPPVRVRMPEVKIPEIKIPEIKVPAADMAPVAQAIQVLSQGLMQLGKQQAAILETLAVLAQRDTSVTVEPPAVTVQAPKRASSYEVELVKSDGETVGMRVVPKR